MRTKPEPWLEDKLRGALRLKQHSPRTEETYIQWYKRNVHLQAQVMGKMRHPAEMGIDEITVFLTHLATHNPPSTGSQNHALQEKMAGN